MSSDDLFALQESLCATIVANAPARVEALTTHRAPSLPALLTDALSYATTLMLPVVKAHGPEVAHNVCRNASAAADKILGESDPVVASYSAALLAAFRYRPNRID